MVNFQAISMLAIKKGAMTMDAKFLLEYDLPKVNDVDVKLGVQSLKDEHQEDTSTNQTFYTEATYAQRCAF